MTNVDEIKAYMEWRQEREGREVDVSPEAYAVELALEALMSEVDDTITTLGVDGDDWLGATARSLRDAQNAYVLARNIANGGL